MELTSNCHLWTKTQELHHRDWRPIPSQPKIPDSIAKPKPSNCYQTSNDYFEEYDQTWGQILDWHTICVGKSAAKTLQQWMHHSWGPTLSEVPQKRRKQC